MENKYVVVYFNDFSGAPSVGVFRRHEDALLRAKEVTECSTYSGVYVAELKNKVTAVTRFEIEEY